MSLDYEIFHSLFIKIINILLFIINVTMIFNNFNLIKGILILCYIITELNELDDINVKKDLIKIILESLSLLLI